MKTRTLLSLVKGFNGDFRAVVTCANVDILIICGLKTLSGYDQITGIFVAVVSKLIILLNGCSWLAL